MFDENGELDLLDQGNRMQVLSDIKSEENVARKREHQKRFDVYNDRQGDYILERLRNEFSEKTVKEMRKILSINLAKRIIDEKSSVYLRKPERSFSTRSGVELTDPQHDQIDALYKTSKVNVTLKRANIFYTLHDQCTIMVVPNKRGGFKVRAIPPLHYDVVPSMHDPEVAHAYILNVWDYEMRKSAKGQSNEYHRSDHRNQAIADDSDRQALLDRYIVWTAEYHFVMNGKGHIMGEIMENPIGALPFVDVAPADKDFQYFVRRGSSTVDFSIDYGMMLSDNANVIRLQAYSQAVIASEKVPDNLTVGPNHILHLKLDPKKPELSPSFQFVTPNPDLAGTQAFLESLLNLHLTSEGQDPSILTSTGQGQRFQSGLDRLLAMISKFEATSDDFDLFRDVEAGLSELLVKWSNEFQDVSGEGELLSNLKISKLPEDLVVSIKFSEPEAVQTKADREDSAIKLMQEGLKSRRQAIMEIYEVDETVADEMIAEIDSEDLPILKSADPDVDIDVEGEDVGASI